jgi:predicted RNA-binding protein with RPS1 domain
MSSLRTSNDSGERDEFGRLLKNGNGNHGIVDASPRDHHEENRQNGDTVNHKNYDNRQEYSSRNHDRRGPYNNNENHANDNGGHYGPTHHQARQGGERQNQDDELVPGLVVRGEVSRIETYGAFVDFKLDQPSGGNISQPAQNGNNSNQPLRGLVHISQIAPQRVAKVEDVLQFKQEVFAVVIEVEQDRGRQRRIRLNMRDVDQNTGEYRGGPIDSSRRGGDGGGGGSGGPSGRNHHAPPNVLIQRAEERRKQFMSLRKHWKDRNDGFSRVPRMLWSSSPEPPSSAKAMAVLDKKKRVPSRKDKDRKDSSSSSSSSETSSSSSSEDDRRRKKQRGSKRGRDRGASNRKRPDRQGRRNQDDRGKGRRRRAKYSSSDNSGSDSDSESHSSSSGSNSSSGSSNPSSSSSSEQRRDSKKRREEKPEETLPVGESSEWRDAQDLKQAIQGKKAPEHKTANSDDEEGPMPLPLSNAATGGAQEAGSSVYGKALLPGEGQAIAQYVQQNLRIPRRGEIGYAGDDIEHFEQSGYVMSGSRHARMNAVRIRKENQVYSAEEQRALALITMEENQQKETQLMEDFRTMLKQKQELRRQERG